MLPAYEDMLETLYRALLKPGDGVIDIGAHVGRHTFPIAAAVGPAGRIFCFEPLPQQFETLRSRIDAMDHATRSGLGTIVPFNFALGEEEGEASFTVVPDCPEYSGFRKRHYSGADLRTEVIQVQVRRLDAFRAEFGKVRYIKVDAEGGELMILRGGKSLIDESRPIVSFELGNASLVNYAYSAADYFDFFKSSGYSVYSIFGQALERDEFVECAQDQYFWDYFAIPAEEGWSFGHKHIGILVRQLAEAGVEAPAHAEANARLDAVLNSLSWRITAPLRRLGALFGAKRGA